MSDIPSRWVNPDADRQAVSDVVTKLLHAVDARDWSAVRALLADTVRTDYVSLFGGEPATQSRDDLVAAWQGLLPGFDATQHLTGPAISSIQGDRARTRCAVTATHTLGELRWVVGGHYDIELVRTHGGWAIASIRLDTAFIDGNRDLPEKARRRISG
jgi:hypothetical protein